MYAREIGEQTHTFGVSGKLIMNALVMYDHQTFSLWSQFLGEAVRGDLKGTKLDFIPVTHTTWSLWNEAHPNTLVLDKSGRYARDAYTGYYRGRAAGVIGEARSDGRLDRKELLVGIEVGDVTKAFPFEVLREHPVVNDTVGDLPVLVFFERYTDTGVAYERSVDGRTLNFAVVGEGKGPEATLIDDETGTTWRALTGEAVSGPLQGTTLDRAVSHLSFWFAWKDWNPETEIYFGPLDPGP